MGSSCLRLALLCAVLMLSACVGRTPRAVDPQAQVPPVAAPAPAGAH